MPALSFRLKLALAMSLLAVGGSVATLFIVQRRLQEYYQRNFRAQFDREITYFLALQETRLAHIKDSCLKLSQKVRIIAAMSEQDIPSQILYDVTDDELMALIGTRNQEPGQPSAPGPPHVNATFFRFLDAQGRPVLPPDGIRDRLGFPLGRERLEEKLADIRGALHLPERQQVAYLAFTLQNNAEPILQEVIITRILDPDSSQTLGALVLGFPLSDGLPQAKVAAEGQPTPADSIHSAILFEDHLYATTNAIPGPISGIVGQALNERIHSKPGAQDDFECRAEDSHYRIFYRLLNSQTGLPPAYQVCVYPLDEARREQNRLGWQILGSGGVALIGALIIGLFLSQGLSVHLRELVRATGEIGRGNLSVRVRVRSRDEIGELAASFNSMAEGLAQKERYRTVLNQVADEKIAKQLVSGEITLGGEVRQASVLFCDIRGFTALTENMPPAEVIEMLNEHMTALAKIVKQHNGVLDKFVGDLLMAIFGAPVSHDSDVLDTAHCALGLLRERERLNQTSRHKLRMGIGLATGRVVAGGMGSVERFHYTVLGERVNLASRLCDVAGPSEILIDQTTFDLLDGRLLAEPMSPVTLKGFAAPVPVWKLLVTNTQPTTP
jgi:class 3 adenylate cyclase